MTQHVRVDRERQLCRQPNARDEFANIARGHRVAAFRYKQLRAVRPVALQLSQRPQLCSPAGLDGKTRIYGRVQDSIDLVMAPLRLHNRNSAITSRLFFFYSAGSYTAVQEIATVTWSSALDGLLIIVAYPVNATCLFTSVKFPNGKLKLND